MNSAAASCVIVGVDMGELAGETVDVAVVSALDLVGFDEAEADDGERLDPRPDGVAVAASREVDEVTDDTQPSPTGISRDDNIQSSLNVGLSR